MPLLLTSYKNKSAGFILRDAKKQITIGRDPGNDMPLPLTRISRVHALITHRDDQWYLRDLGSSNGTKVNNIRIKGTVHIRPGDRVRLGNVRMQFMDTEMIPKGIKRLKDRRDNQERIRFKCKYCSHSLKAFTRDAGRKIQCHHCDQIVHIPGHQSSLLRKLRQRPESPMALRQDKDERHSTLMIDSAKMQTLNDDAKAHKDEAVTVDDLHNELAQVTPEQQPQNKESAKDQAQAMRQLRKAEIKQQLFRDDRSGIEKIYSKMLIAFVLQYSKLKDPTYPVHRWHVAVMAMALIGFIGMRLFFGVGQAGVQAAPSEFAVTCANCQHESHISLEKFEQVSFYMMHPDSFNQKYPGEPIPEPIVCEDCGKKAVALRLTVNPNNGERSVLAVTDANTSMQMAKAK